MFGCRGDCVHRQFQTGPIECNAACFLVLVFLEFCHLPRKDVEELNHEQLTTVEKHEDQ